MYINVSYKLAAYTATGILKWVIILTFLLFQKLFLESKMDGQYFFSISEFHVNFKNLECGIWKKKDFFIVFFGKFDRDSQNCLLKMRFGIQNNLNMLNSMAKWPRFSALH